MIPKSIIIEIPTFMLWEAARSQALTADNWASAMEKLKAELKRETDETGGNRIYSLLGECAVTLANNGDLRALTDLELKQDKPCPFYTNERHPDAI